jgi:L-threonylcarbamoyladenylate synthase
MQAIRQLLKRLVGPRTLVTIAPTMETRVLTCDPSSITFSEDGSVSISAPDTQAALLAASDILTEDKGVVVFPTETVYGLGAAALDPSAVSLIYSTKGRPSDNPLIVHISSKAMLQSLLPPSYTIPPTYTKLMDAFWPGPLTLLFPANPGVVPNKVTAGHPTVAVRMPSHPVARALITLADMPLAAPSANSSGKPSPTKAEHVIADLQGRVSLILDGGPCDVGLESTVVDGLAADGHLRVLRPGGAIVEDLQRIVEGTGVRVLVHHRDYKDEQQEAAPSTPGMKYRHYAPRSPVYLLMQTSTASTDFKIEAEKAPSVREAIASLLTQLPCAAARELGQAGARAVKVGLLSCPDSPLTAAIGNLACEWSDRAGSRVRVEWIRRALGGLGEPSVTARVLFDGLISLDQEGVEVILVEGIEETREGLAVMNRVRKAAGETVWVRV